MFKLSFLLIKKAIESIEGIPGVFWYNAQYDQESEEAVYYVPAVYIEYLPLTVQEMGSQIQAADIRFRIHLMTEYNNDIDLIMNHFDLADKIHKKLSNFEPLQSSLPEYAALAGTDEDRLVMSKCGRTQIIPDHSQSNITITIQEYVSRVMDITAFPECVEGLVTIEVQRPD